MIGVQDVSHLLIYQVAYIIDYNKNPTTENRDKHPFSFVKLIIYDLYM